MSIKIELILNNYFYGTNCKTIEGDTEEGCLSEETRRQWKESAGVDLRRVGRTGHHFRHLFHLHRQLMSGLEIERKFLVKNDDYKRQAYSSSRICQGYICSGHGRTVRVRIRGDRGYLTIKGPSNVDGISRYEFEKEITLEEAQELMKLCEPGLIDKTRYLVKSGNHTFEVDEFYGENEGLVMAEVELRSEDEPFEKPDFIGQEVTGDRRYYNGHLRTYPYKLWGITNS